MSETLSPLHADPDAAAHNPAASLTQVVVRRDRGRARTDIGKGTMHGPEVPASSDADAAARQAEGAPTPPTPPRAPEQKTPQTPPQAPAHQPRAEPAADPNAAAGEPDPGKANGAAAAYAQRARASAAGDASGQTTQARARPQAPQDKPPQPAPTARKEPKPQAAGKAAPDPTQTQPAPPKPAPQPPEAAAPSGSGPAPASTEEAAKRPSELAPKAKTPAESQRKRPLVAPEPPRAERDAAVQARAAAKPAPQPGPASEAPAGASENSGAEATPAGPQGLVALWKQSAGTRDFPAIEDIDLGAVAENWPNSLLLRVHEGGRPDVEVVRIFRSHTVEAMDTVTIERMMALVRETGRSGEPMHESDPVPSGDTEKALGIIALPFGRAPDAVDHVLCHAFRHGGSAAASAAGTRGRIAEPEQDQGQRSVFSKLFGW